jgi:hypothetical protein
VAVPAEGALEEPHVAVGVAVASGREGPAGELAQAVVQPVDHHDGGRRIVEGLGDAALGAVPARSAGRTRDSAIEASTHSRGTSHRLQQAVTQAQ